MRNAYVVVSLALAGMAACGDNLQGNRSPSASDSNVTTPEDTPVSITVNASDPDPDDGLIFTFTPPEHGTITQDGGTITYRPDDDYNGPDSIHVDITDGTYDVSAEIAITVTPVNDAPVAVDDALAGNEDTAATVTGAALVANDDDVENDALTVTMVGNPSTGTVGLVGDTITYTPPANFTGSATFEYTVSDGAAADVGLVNVTVGGVNDPPVAVADTLTTAEDTAGTITAAMLVQNDTDTEMQSLSVTGVSAPVNGTVNLAGGTVTFTPDANYNGAASFTYTVSDGAATANGTVNVTVTAVNDTPVANAGSATVNEDGSVTITLTGSDVENASLIFSIVTPPTVGTLGTIMPVNATSATVVYTPNPGSGVDDSFTFRVNDGTLDSTPATVTIDVLGINDVPVATAGSAMTNEDTPVTITLAGTDADGDALTFAIGTQPTAGSLGTITQLTPTTASVTYTPNLNSTTDDSFTFTVNDTQATSAPATVTIDVVPVNDPPVANAGSAQTNEDTAVTITLSGSDQEGSNLTFAIATPPNQGLLGAITQLTPTTASVTYTPALNNGNDTSFTFTVNDGTTDSTAATVTIDVVPQNDPPVAMNRSVMTNEDTPVVVMLLGTDVESDPLTFEIVGVPSGGTLGPITQQGPNAATVTFMPTANSSVDGGFQYRVVDDSNAPSAPATVAVDVIPIDDPPVADPVTTSTNEDTPVTITLSATDVEGAAITFAIVTGPSAGSLGSITQLTPSSASVTYTPSSNSTADDSFTYRATASGVDSAPATVSIDVVPVNDPPVAVDDSDATAQDQPLVRAASVYSANDTDIDGGPLNITAVGGAVNGSVVLDAGTITFTPTTGFSGAASFTYTVSDGAGGTATGTVNITVFVNTPPVAVDDTDNTNEDTALLMVNAALISDDIDPDPQTLTVTGFQNPVNGTLVAQGPNMTFVPTPNYFGPASFEYIVSDGVATDVGLVSVTVASVNDLPVANNDSATVAEDAPATIVDVLTNDSDVEGAATVTGVTQGANGTVTLNTGVVSYQPNANFAGTDTFTYTITDSDSATSTATVTMTVTPVNDGPVANNATATTNEGAFVTVTLTATDIDSPSVTFAIASNPTNGTLGAITSTGNFTATVRYTPTGTFFGGDSFTFTASDASLTSAPATASITVNNVITCGDSLIEAPETCDDANTVNFDGCSSACLAEQGWSCVGVPSACDEICGDPFVVGAEECDDNNGVETDGCTTSCKLAAACNNVALPGGDRFTVDTLTGHCYVSFDDDMTNFADAQTACVAVTGNLASITSVGEQGLVASVHNTLQNPWIGLTDAVVEGSFGWITGETMSFNGFATGQPDGGEPEDCANLFSVALAPAGETSRWNDTSCTFTGFVQGRICELEAPCGNGVPQAGEACDDGDTDPFDGCNATCKLETIFFSEYIEGTSNNKAIEIANPTGAPFNLTGCALRLYSNGSATVSQSVTLTQTIAAGDVFVVCNSSAVAAITGQCDLMNNSVINYNGDDAVELFCNGATRDAFGQIGFDPGTEWGTGLTSTADNTLRRKCNVTIGDTVGNNVFNPGDEWGGFATDTFGGIGSYQCYP